jgi:hypothetical protein
MVPNRAQALAKAPITDLLTILLRQFKRPLATQGVTLTDADAQALAEAIAQRAPDSDLRAAVRAALIVLIDESESVLAQWHLRFEQSLDTTLDKLPGWDSTAEFLAIANEKANAELRIAAGAALLTTMGDLRHADKLLLMYERDEGDPDALIGKRMLSFVAGIDPNAKYWRVLAKVWLDEREEKGN